MCQASLNWVCGSVRMCSEIWSLASPGCYEILSDSLTNKMWENSHSTVTNSKKKKKLHWDMKRAVKINKKEDPTKSAKCNGKKKIVSKQISKTLPRLPSFWPVIFWRHGSLVILHQHFRNFKVSTLAQDLKVVLLNSTSWGKQLKVHRV